MQKVRAQKMKNCSNEMTLICIKYRPTSGALSVNCCLFGEKRKFLPIGCAGLVCTLVHMSIMRNTGGKNASEAAKCLCIELVDSSNLHR